MVLSDPMKSLDLRVHLARKKDVAAEAAMREVRARITALLAINKPDQLVR